MSLFCCHKEWTWSFLGVFVFFILFKVFKQFKLKKLKKSYFYDKCVLITGASAGLGRGDHHFLIEALVLAVLIVFIPYSFG